MAALLADVLAKKPARRWVAQLSVAGVPCEQVAMTHFQDELFTSEEALASGRVVEFIHPVHGRIREIGPLIRFVWSLDCERFHCHQAAAQSA